MRAVISLLVLGNTSGAIYWRKCVEGLRATGRARFDKRHLRASSWPLLTEKQGCSISRGNASMTFRETQRKSRINACAMPLSDWPASTCKRHPSLDRSTSTCRSAMRLSPTEIVRVRVCFQIRLARSMTRHSNCGLDPIRCVPRRYGQVGSVRGCRDCRHAEHRRGHPRHDQQPRPPSPGHAHLRGLCLPVLFCQRRRQVSRSGDPTHSTRMS